MVKRRAGGTNGRWRCDREMRCVWFDDGALKQLHRKRELEAPLA